MSINNPKSKAVSLFLLLLVVVLGFALIYVSFLLKESRKSVEDLSFVNIDPSTSAVESEGIKEDPTENWKTYVNEEFKISFRYPSNDLEVVVCPGTVVDSIYIVPTVDKRRFTPCESSGGNLYIQWRQVDYVLEANMYRDYDI